MYFSSHQLSAEESVRLEEIDKMKVTLQKVVSGKSFLFITSLKKQHISYFYLVGKLHLSEIPHELLKKSYDLKKIGIFHALVGFN